MCLTADVPLIESGSAGYLGQVTVIKKVAGFSLSLETRYNGKNITFLSFNSCFE